MTCTYYYYYYTNGEQTVPDLCRSVYHFFFAFPHNGCGGRGNNRGLW